MFLLHLATCGSCATIYRLEVQEKPRVHVFSLQTGIMHLSFKLKAHNSEKKILENTTERFWILKVNVSHIMWYIDLEKLQITGFASFFYIYI